MYKDDEHIDRPSIYSDLPKDIDSDILRNIDAIFGSIENIIIVRLWTRHFARDFGSETRAMLFEAPITEDSAFDILGEVMDAVSREDKRIKLVNRYSKTMVDYTIGKLDLTLAFKIMGYENQIFYVEKQFPILVDK